MVTWIVIIGLCVVSAIFGIGGLEWASGFAGGAAFALLIELTTNGRTS